MSLEQTRKIESLFKILMWVSFGISSFLLADAYYGLKEGMKSMKDDMKPFVDKVHEHDGRLIRLEEWRVQEAREVK